MIKFKSLEIMKKIAQPQKKSQEASPLGSFLITFNFSMRLSGQHTLRQGVCKQHLTNRK